MHNNPEDEPVRNLPHTFFFSALVGVSLMSGCGASDSAGTSSGPAQPLQITMQPTSQTVPLASQALFAVTASGSGALHYQWFRDDVPVGGATASSISTPAVSLADAGAQYSVRVSDSRTELKSIEATISIGARSPKAGDLRFQQVGAPTTRNGYGGNGCVDTFSNNGGCVEDVGLVGPIALEGAECGGDPSQGTGGCVWECPQYSPGDGSKNLSSGFIAYAFDTYEDVLRGYFPYPYPTASGNLLDGKTVITSLLIDTHNQFGLAYMRTRDTGTFDGRQVDSTVATLSAEAAALGAQGRIITGLSFNGNGIRYFNYGWDQDPDTRYETSVKTATFSDYVAVVADLSSQGYIITAFTGDNDHGIVMVGARVKGDTLPRPFKSGLPNDFNSEGYAQVGIVYRTSDSQYAVRLRQR